MQKLIVDILATGFYSGKLGRAPGTIGSLTCTALIWLLFITVPELFLSKFSPILFVALPTLISILVCSTALRLKLYGESSHDPQQIVIDEFAGMFAAVGLCINAGFGPVELLVCLGLFRFFDILKPFPISRLERLPGGVGITLDDTAAGLAAGAIAYAFFAL